MNDGATDCLPVAAGASYGAVNWSRGTGLPRTLAPAEFAKRIPDKTTRFAKIVKEGM